MILFSTSILRIYNIPVKIFLIESFELAYCILDLMGAVSGALKQKEKKRKEKKVIQLANPALF